MRRQLRFVVLLVVLCAFGVVASGHDIARIALAVTPPVTPAPSASALEVLRAGLPLQKDKPTANINAFLKTAAAQKLDAATKNKLVFFDSYMLKNRLPTLDSADLRLVLEDALDLKGNLVDSVFVLASGTDTFVVIAIGGGWLKYGTIPNYDIRFIKNVQQYLFYPVYASQTTPGTFLPVITDVPPVADSSGSINYLLPDGTILAGYDGKYVKEASTGFFLNVSQDVGEYIEAVNGKQLYHYGWQAYLMATEKAGNRWRILPKPAIDDILFFKTKLLKAYTDNMPIIKQIYSQVPSDTPDVYQWSADNVSKSIANYRFPGVGAATPVLLDSGTVDISPAFFAQELPKVTFSQGSLDIAASYSLEKYQISYAQDQIATAILYPFRYPETLSLYDRFRLASALTVADSKHFAPITIHLLRPDNLPNGVAADMSFNGQFRMNAGLIPYYVKYPGTATGIISHELGHYIESYSIAQLQVDLDPVIDGKSILEAPTNIREPFNYLRTMRDDAELTLSHRVDPNDLLFEYYQTSTFISFITSAF